MEKTRVSNDWLDYQFYKEIGNGIVFLFTKIFSHKKVDK